MRLPVAASATARSPGAADRRPRLGQRLRSRHRPHPRGTRASDTIPDRSMLRIETDDETTGLLVLRAPPPTRALMASRVMATGVALCALAAAGALLGWSDALPPFYRGLMSAAVLWIALIAVTAPSVEVTELGVDGARRRLWFVVRGEWCWRTRRAEVNFEAVNRRLRVVGGLIPPGVDGPEMGLELWEALEPVGDRGIERSVTASEPLTPRFAVAGLDRREEVRAFGEHLARRLDLRIEHDEDTLHALSVTIGHAGRAPSPREASLTGLKGYRDRIESRPLDLSRPLDPSRPASFEAPGVAPDELAVLLPRGSTNPEGAPSPRARELLPRVDLHPVLTVIRPEQSLRSELLRAGKWLTLWYLVVAGVAWLGASAQVWQGLAWLPVVLLAFCASVALAVALCWAPISLGTLISARLSRAASSRPPEQPSWRRPRQWRLDGRGLELQSWWGGRFTRVDRAELGPAALVLRRYRYRSVRWASELWIRKGSRWILLADTTQTSHVQSTPTLDALGVHVARALDVPLRTASRL